MNCNLAPDQLDNNANKLSSIADIYTMHQLIIDPTQCTVSSSTLIDLIYTSSPDRVVCSGVSHISISDHSLVYAFRKLSIEFPSRGHNTVTYRKVKNFNSDRFRNDIYCHDNPNDMWDAWKKLFFSCVDRHAPLRTKRVRSCKSPWITLLLKKHMHKRDLLKIKASRSKDPMTGVCLKLYVTK